MAETEVDRLPSIGDSARPDTQSGYRFGQLSRNAFFARHNPQPSRVTHLRGSWGKPVCHVNDDPLIILNSLDGSKGDFPPNFFMEYKLQSQMPVNSGMLMGPSRSLPIDTISALKFFTGLKNYSFRERAVPKLGMVPVTDTWRSELRTLTESVIEPFIERKLQKIQEQEQQQQNGQSQHPAEWLMATPKSPQKTPLYSPATGRLVPPSSRSLSRQSKHSRISVMTNPVPRSTASSQRGSTGHLPAYDHISLAPDMEGQVFTMLCGILQTEDVHAVQAWLSSATEREKALVREIISVAFSNKDEYYNINPEGTLKMVPPTPVQAVLPTISEDGAIIGGGEGAERLLVHNEEAKLETEGDKPVSITDGKSETKEQTEENISTTRPTSVPKDEIQNDGAIKQEPKKTDDVQQPEQQESKEDAIQPKPEVNVTVKDVLESTTAVSCTRRPNDDLKPVKGKQDKGIKKTINPNPKPSSYERQMKGTDRTAAGEATERSTAGGPKQKRSSPNPKPSSYQRQLKGSTQSPGGGPQQKSWNPEASTVK